MEKKFMLSNKEKIGGVCGGVANYFNIDPTLVRVVWFIASWYYGIGILIYLALWMVAPREDDNNDGAAPTALA